MRAHIQTDKQTDRQRHTDMNIAILRTPPDGEVISIKFTNTTLKIQLNFAINLQYNTIIGLL